MVSMALFQAITFPSLSMTKVASGRKIDDAREQALFVTELLFQKDILSLHGDGPPAVRKKKMREAGRPRRLCETTMCSTRQAG